jgi:hypothetical protein
MYKGIKLLGRTFLFQEGTEFPILMFLFPG